MQKRLGDQLEAGMVYASITRGDFADGSNVADPSRMREIRTQAKA